MSGVTERPGATGKRRLMPLRRRLARFALVDQERDRRVEQTRKEITELEGRLRQDVDRLTGAVGRIQQENAALLRLLSGPKEEPEAIGKASGASRQESVSRHALFSEVERGSRAEVIETLGKYMASFGGRGPVCDLGCGRGEFLELARAQGLEAYGVDSDAESVAACRAFCSQVVEHLPPDLLPVLMREVHRVLVPTGAAVFETPNPATFATHVHSFWRDPTHIRPVPEPALSFAARTAGFVVEDVVLTSRVPKAQRLSPLPTDSPNEQVRALAVQLNATVERLNDLLYGYQDYALIVRKPA
jgi:SAM-dependent methyltransferase